VSPILAITQSICDDIFCLGSNVFNINVALGLAWFIYVAADNHAYQDMKDNGLFALCCYRIVSNFIITSGIVMFIVLLEIVCVIWFAMIAACGFKMYAWMAYVFIIIYIIVLVTAVAEA
jgi:Ca2+/Na+ antiporter